MVQAQSAPREDVELAFKRFILTESADFASEPAADLFRVNLLGRMLDRYDELIGQQVSPQTAQTRVKREFSDIAQMMRDQDFDLAEDGFTASRWPQLTEEEAAQYIQESDSQLHKTAGHGDVLRLRAAADDRRGVRHLDRKLARRGVLFAHRAGRHVCDDRPGHLYHDDGGEAEEA